MFSLSATEAAYVKQIIIQYTIIESHSLYIE